MLSHPIVVAALAGLVVATEMDRRMFKSFQSFHEFATYDWRLALWRAVQGAAIGAGTALGLTF